VVGDFELQRRAELEMREYYEMLKTAIDGLERDEVEQRQAVYLNARNDLIRKVRATSPPLAPADIARRRLKLEQAIREIERQSAANTVPAQAAAASETIDDGGYNTGSVLEMASTPVEIEPAPEDVFRRAIEAAKNCGRIETSVAASPPRDKAVRMQVDKDTTVTAGPTQLRIDDEHAVRVELLLGPSDLELTTKTGRDQPEPRVLPARSERDSADVMDLSLERKARRRTLLLGVLITVLALGAVALAWSQRATMGQIITTVHGKGAGGT
jgi:hypothetical protein